MKFKFGKYKLKLDYKTVVTVAVGCVVLASLLFYFAFLAPTGNNRSPRADNSPVVTGQPTNRVPPAPARRPDVTESPLEGEEAQPEDMTGYVNSKLTNLPIPEEISQNRPVAVVINNMYRALPQSGILNADIIYEVLAEGDITRLVCVMQDYNLPKIGPVRSARDYFVDFALDYDAIFIHHGGSPSGYSKLRGFGIDRMDGLSLEGVYFWRDRTYPAWSGSSGQTRPMEHSSYTGGWEIGKAIADYGMRKELYGDSAFGFSFYEDENIPVNLAAGPAETVTVPFSANYTRKFVYDPETKLYAAENRDGPHVEAETGGQLTVRNIIVQLTDSYVIAGDDAGRRAVGTVGSGGGYATFEGVYRPVTWEKPNERTPTRWYFADGSELRLAAGKTWICVFQDYGAVTFE